MARRKKKRPPPRYSWALSYRRTDPELRHASQEAIQGLEYAQALARNRRDRSANALYGRWALPDKLTIEDLAAQHETTTIKIHTKIKQARIAIFGSDLSQSAIYYRLKHRRQHRYRTCAHPDCQQEIPPQEPISRLYCWEHRKPKYRTRRHRQNRRHQQERKNTTTQPPPTTRPADPQPR